MRRKHVAALLAASCLAGSAGAGQALAEERVYTLDADFDEGTIVNLNHDPNHDQLQVNFPVTKPLPFIVIPASARGTVVRVHTETGEILGEYKTAPENRATNPSRTIVDVFGNMWTANRLEEENNSGSTIKIGIVAGGTRCDADGTENSDGDYLKLMPGSLSYNTCIDRNKDGLIRTSRGLGDILPWPDKGDGVGGADGLVQDAEDECILIYQRLLDAPNARHVSVDRENNLWVAGHPYEPRMFYKLDGETGAILDHFDARKFGCGGYGGLISDNNFDGIAGNDILWSASPCQNSLLRYDISTGEGQCIAVPGYDYPDLECTSYGLAVDNDGFVWNNLYGDNTITKINPDTALQLPGFPVATGGSFGRGVAVTTKDNNIWSVNTGTSTVSRLDASGKIIAIINSGGVSPTGISVDAAGKVWVTNSNDNAARIDPESNKVDLTVNLGAGAGPYNYSDMTGIIRLGHPPLGFWEVVHDSEDCTTWDKVSWTGEEDPGAGDTIKVEVRAASTRVGLAAMPFVSVTNGAELEGIKGRFVEVRATLVNEDRDVALPVLKDLTLSSHPVEVALRDVPDQKYRHGFAPIDLDDFLRIDDPSVGPEEVEWSHSEVPPGWSVSIDEDHVATVTCPDGETEDVPVVFTARLVWGGEECAASDEVVFLANHPPVRCGEPYQCLWSPHNKYEDVPLGAFVCDPDGDPVSISISSVTSDEPTASRPKDDKSPDAEPECMGTDTARIRAERYTTPGYDGRVYMVSFVASDGRGGETEMTLPVWVPRNSSGECKAVDSGQVYDATKISLKPKR